MPNRTLDPPPADIKKHERAARAFFDAIIRPCRSRGIMLVEDIHAIQKNAYYGLFTKEKTYRFEQIWKQPLYQPSSKEPVTPAM